MNYENKYIKYKQKYITLKNQLKGGHTSGLNGLFDETDYNNSNYYNSNSNSNYNNSDDNSDDNYNNNNVNNYTKKSIKFNQICKNFDKQINKYNNAQIYISKYMKNDSIKILQILFHYAIDFILIEQMDTTTINYYTDFYFPFYIDEKDYNEYKNLYDSNIEKINTFYNNLLHNNNNNEILSKFKNFYTFDFNNIVSNQIRFKDNKKNENIYISKKVMNYKGHIYKCNPKNTDPDCKIIDFLCSKKNNRLIPISERTDILQKIINMVNNNNTKTNTNIQLTNLENLINELDNNYNITNYKYYTIYNLTDNKLLVNNDKIDTDDINIIEYINDYKINNINNINYNEINEFINKYNIFYIKDIEIYNSYNRDKITNFFKENSNSNDIDKCTNMFKYFYSDNKTSQIRIKLDKTPILNINKSIQYNNTNILCDSLFWCKNIKDKIIPISEKIQILEEINKMIDDYNFYLEKKCNLKALVCIYNLVIKLDYNYYITNNYYYNYDNNSIIKILDEQIL